MSCRRKDGQCNGRLAVKAKGLSAAKSFKIAKRKAKTLKLKFSKGEVKKLRKAKKKQMKGLGDDLGQGVQRQEAGRDARLQAAVSAR